jgi:trehalose/maltose hydrolase-like predicted phosphorylase
MTPTENWTIKESEFPKENYSHKETVFTIGNGYFSSRGGFEEGYPDENATTFVHGVFNDVPVYKTELVNFPTWYAICVNFEDEVFNLSSGKILAYDRDLNMANGLLTRRVTWQSPQGRQATIQFERFMNMANLHHGALRFCIDDIRFEGQVSIQAAIPGVVSNERYRHWRHINQGRYGENSSFLELETMETGIRAGISQAVHVNADNGCQCAYWDAHWMPTQTYLMDIKPGDRIEGTKHCVIYTSRDVDQPGSVALNEAVSLSDIGFDQSLQENQKVWTSLWDNSNITIEGDDCADRALRYNLFQILVAAPRHDDTISIGAKTLSGYGYRGHVFWDTEIFILPFLIFTQPKIAKNLLMYRYHTLPGARAKAKEQGFEGAMFAWESAATGEEVTPKWVTGPEGELIRVWCGDIEQHITADVVYAIKQYWQATGDDAFMKNFGAEIVFSAAQFYASRLEWQPDTESYHIRNVIGPDEYHEHVDNNAFTNLMGKWVLEFSEEVKDWLKTESSRLYTALLKKLNLNEQVLDLWPEMASKITLHVGQDGVIEQFEGYFDLAFKDQGTLEPRDQSLQSIFGVEGVQQYQFIKQPDVVMALYLLRGWFDRQQIIENMAFYTPRTDLSFGSSLGPSIQATMLARYGDVEEAKALFLSTLLTDLENNRGNTPDGIHAASAGAVWQVTVFGFAGLSLNEGKPYVHPRLPQGWERVGFKVHWKNREIPFDINQKYAL